MARPRKDVTVQDVLQAWQDIATADPNEICEFRRVCCRHCYGREFRYQFTDGEFRAAKERKKAAKTNGGTVVEDTAFMGGAGFDGSRKPNPKCPECFGEGVGQAFFKDTRKLSRGARALYAGVKITKESVEIKLHSQEKALEMIAKHLGMLIERMKVEGDVKITEVKVDV